MRFIAMLEVKDGNSLEFDAFKESDLSNVKLRLSEVKTYTLWFELKDKSVLSGGCKLLEGENYLINLEEEGVVKATILNFPEEDDEKTLFVTSIAKFGKVA